MGGPRQFLTPEQAVAMLPNGEYIHTFRQAGFAVLGCDVARADIIEKINQFKPELSGEMATGMGHGLAIDDDRGFIFIETK